MIGKNRLHCSKIFQMHNSLPINTLYSYKYLLSGYISETGNYLNNQCIGFHNKIFLLHISYNSQDLSIRYQNLCNTGFLNIKPNQNCKLISLHIFSNKNIFNNIVLKNLELNENKLNQFPLYKNLQY